MVPPTKAVPGMKTKKPQPRVASEEDGNRGSSNVLQGVPIPMVNIPGSGSLTVQPQPPGVNGGGTANHSNSSSSQAPVAAINSPSTSQPITNGNGGGSQTQTSQIGPQVPAAALTNPSRGSQPTNTGSQTQTASHAPAAAISSASPSGSESQPTAEGTDRDKALRNYFEREWWACVSMSCFFIFWDLLILPTIVNHSDSDDTDTTNNSSDSNKSDPKLSKPVRKAVRTIAIIAALLGLCSIYSAYSLSANPFSLLHRKTPKFFMMWSGLLSIVTLAVVMIAWKA